ncbi:hypothetical protein ACJJIP_06505 [Microbulbifer sp. VTAC004]|uniref:hypothetical protein n=1 Tax=unclassified Microbulbifer TaxID=2619833 RepID=UPI004039DB77
MPSISYTPTRELVDGSSGSLSFTATRCNRTPKSTGKEHTALSGNTESVLYRRDIEWQISVSPFFENQLQLWREFEASCANGEAFELDTSDIPGGRETAVCRLKRNGFREMRQGAFEFYVTFTAIEV